MFEIQQSDPSDMTTKRVVDPERDVSLELVALPGRNPGGAYVLRTPQATVPFETSEQDGLRDAGGLYRRTTFTSFGSSLYASTRAGITPAIFASAEDEQALMMLAIEAILIFGDYYNGFASRPLFYRVEFAGKVFTRQDFGYSK